MGCNLVCPRPHQLRTTFCTSYVSVFLRYGTRHAPDSLYFRLLGLRLEQGRNIIQRTLLSSVQSSFSQQTFLASYYYPFSCLLSTVQNITISSADSSGLYLSAQGVYRRQLIQSVAILYSLQTTLKSYPNERRVNASLQLITRCSPAFFLACGFKISHLSVYAPFYIGIRRT